MVIFLYNLYIFISDMVIFLYNSIHFLLIWSFFYIIYTFLFLIWSFFYIIYIFSFLIWSFFYIIYTLLFWIQHDCLTNMVFALDLNNSVIIRAGTGQCSLPESCFALKTKNLNIIFSKSVNLISRSHIRVRIIQHKTRPVSNISMTSFSLRKKVAKKFMLN